MRQPDTLQSRHPRRAMTLFEVMVVVSLSSVVLLAASKIMTGTTRSFKKGSELLTTQLLLESITERLRSDVRAMIFEPTQKDAANQDVSEKKCSLTVYSSKGTEGKKIVYEFDSEKKSLTRKDEEENKRTDFQADGKIRNLVFQWNAGSGNLPGYLTLVIEIVSKEPGEGRETKLPFVCNFFPKCVTPKMPEYLTMGE